MLLEQRLEALHRAAVAAGFVLVAAVGSAGAAAGCSGCFCLVTVERAAPRGRQLVCLLVTQRGYTMNPAVYSAAMDAQCWRQKRTAPGGSS
jgi:hypothetical protein